MQLLQNTDLTDGDLTLSGQLLLGLLARVRVAQVRVEVFVQDLCGLLAEVSPLSPVKTNTEVLKNWFSQLKRAEKLPQFS